MKLTTPVKGKLSYAPDGIISQYFNDQNISKELLAFYQSLGLKAHNGIDFYGVRGTPIYAAHSGIATTWLGEGGATSGKMIKLQGQGYYTLYMHNDELLVKTGESVTQGQIIAKMGNSGSSPSFYMGVHSHFGLYQCDSRGNVINYNNGFGGAIDPLPYLNNMKYVILGKEQYLLEENLKIALNIGDEIELAKLQLRGLPKTPEQITCLDGYLIYPLVEASRLKDLFGI
jgi:murein DD-endopeptidase MepM/ murein hydrolase activator NlpD